MTQSTNHNIIQSVETCCYFNFYTDDQTIDQYAEAGDTEEYPKDQYTEANDMEVYNQKLDILKSVT